MQRWHVSWDYMQDNWTASQYLCLLATVIEDSEEQERRANERASGRKPGLTNAQLVAMGM